jgi:DNA-directed RNA polymerase specialized sigma24 family protein
MSETPPFAPLIAIRELRDECREMDANLQEREDAELARLARLYSPAEIAEACGVTPTRVRERLRRIGVKPPGRLSESERIGRTLGRWLSDA